MSDFTSTGLVSLLVAALQRTDPDLLDGTPRPDPMARATELDGTKRALIERVMRRHGPGPLLDVGQHLGEADETPVLAVLRHPSPSAVLAEKWMRLERYHHASHRTRIDAGRAGLWRCERHGKGAAPTLGENCLIAGLLLGLLGLAGRHDCRLELEGRTLRPRELSRVTLPPGASGRRFTLRWQPLPADGTEPAAAPPASVRCGALPSATADRLTDLLATDIGRGWRVTDAARALALSDRSLQRLLAAEERSFSGTLRRARMRAATTLLTDGDTSLADIGYCCGYADQAHFQRDFLRATNLTPRAFRRIATGADGSGAILQ